ncbi:hypothetical protein LMG26685_02894 [Achromobacter mucicolens]|nr:hypothetical protein LMG26685_02894 [Achromobacter mucicolens]
MRGEGYQPLCTGVMPRPPGSTIAQEPQLDRIEAKLDALLDALADEGEEMEQPELTLDGEAVGGERDDSQPL